MMAASKLPRSLGFDQDESAPSRLNSLGRIGVDRAPAANRAPAGLRLGAGIFASPDSDMALGPLIRELTAPKTRLVRVLEFVSKWGRNASPFKIAMTQVRLHWKGVDYWRKVSEAAAKGRALLKHVDDLESGARALERAIRKLAEAERKVPRYPLSTELDRFWVGATELEDVERYFNTTVLIANEALDTAVELRKAIDGWDSVVFQAKKTEDFTRAAVWDAINELNMRFTNEGGDFRTFLVDSRDSALAVERFARRKQYHAAHILDKPTPDWYVPPSPPE
jgi:hypothetical protein